MCKGSAHHGLLIEFILMPRKYSRGRMIHCDNMSEVYDCMCMCGCVGVRDESGGVQRKQKLQWTHTNQPNSSQQHPILFHTAPHIHTKHFGSTTHFNINYSP